MGIGTLQEKLSSCTCDPADGGRSYPRLSFNFAGCSKVCIGLCGAAFIGKCPGVRGFVCLPAWNDVL